MCLCSHTCPALIPLDNTQHITTKHTSTHLSCVSVSMCLCVCLTMCVSDPSVRSPYFLGIPAFLSTQWSNRSASTPHLTACSRHSLWYRWRAPPLLAPTLASAATRCRVPSSEGMCLVCLWCVCVFRSVCVCVCARSVCVCVCVCMYVCVRALSYVRAQSRRQRLRRHH